MGQTPFQRKWGLSRFRLKLSCQGRDQAALRTSTSLSSLPAMASFATSKS